MTDKQQQTLNQIRAARAKERPELTDEITTKEDGRHLFVYQGNLPAVRIGPGGGIYLPESKSFATLTPQTDPTPLEAGTFPEKYTTEAIAVRKAERQKAEAEKKAAVQQQPVAEQKQPVAAVEKPQPKEPERKVEQPKAKPKGKPVVVTKPKAASSSHKPDLRKATAKQ